MIVDVSTGRVGRLFRVCLQRKERLAAMSPLGLLAALGASGAF
jgi:hypothetical protein